MKTFLSRYSTPLITGLFAVSTLSGVALFFHWTPSAFHAMHEWLSMVLLAPFALHLWKNWKGLLAYVKRRTLWLPLAASLVVAVPFAAVGLSGSPGGNPAFRTVALLIRVPLTELAPVLDTTPAALVAALEGRGYRIAGAEATLAEVAAGNDAPANELLYALLPGG